LFGHTNRKKLFGHTNTGLFIIYCGITKIIIGNPQDSIYGTFTDRRNNSNFFHQ
jgi:hypothetical protein